MLKVNYITIPGAEGYLYVFDSNGYMKKIISWYTNKSLKTKNGRGISWRQAFINWVENEYIPGIKNKTDEEKIIKHVININGVLFHEKTRHHTYVFVTNDVEIDDE